MMRAAIPAGTALAALHPAFLGDEPGPAHAQARGFCLAVIKEVYGFDYRPDWHADLDALTGPASGNPYAAAQGGAFLVLRKSAGALAATAAVQALAFKPRVAARLAGRYPDPSRVAHLARVYVRRDLRGGGLGRRLAAMAERRAAALGYARIYLHAHSATAATIGFWRGRGYAEIGTAEDHTDFDKPLAAREDGIALGSDLGAKGATG